MQHVLTKQNTVERLHILIISELFPNPDYKYSGTFVVSQLLHLAQWNSIDVIVPYYVPIKRFFSRSKKQDTQGLNVHYLSLYAYDLYALLFLKLIDYPTMKLQIKKRSARAIAKMASRLHRNRPFTVIHGHEAYIGDEAGPIGRSLNIPSVVTLHSMFPFHQSVFGEPAMQLVKRNLHIVDKIIAVSQLVRASYEKENFNPSQFITVPNGVELATYRPPLRERIGIAASDTVLLSVGTLAPNKRFDLSIHALHYLHSQGHLDTHLLIVGKGQEQKRLATLAFSLGCGKNVHFLGEMAPRDMGSVYRTADVLLHPSVVDSFSMVCLESMAHGLPVICTDAIGLNEYIKPNRDAIVVAANDTRAFIAAAFDVTQSQNLREQLRQAGLKKAGELSWSNTAKQLQALYLSLIARQKNG